MGLFDVFSGKRGLDMAEKGLDAGIRGIDALFHTEEEKAAYHAKMGEAWLETQKVLNDESSPRSVSRRYIAWAVVANSLFVADLCIVLKLMGRDITGIVEVVNAFHLGWAFVAVILFYFGTHVAKYLKGG